MINLQDKCVHFYKNISIVKEVLKIVFKRVDY